MTTKKKHVIRGWTCKDYKTQDIIRGWVDKNEKASNVFHFNSIGQLTNVFPIIYKTKQEAGENARRVKITVELL